MAIHIFVVSSFVAACVFQVQKYRIESNRITFDALVLQFYVDILNALTLFDKAKFYSTK